MSSAYSILHFGYSIAPVIAGADKFAHLLTDWNKYLAPIFPQLFGIPPSTLMAGVGIVEIMAGALTFLRPRIGAYIVAAWLLGIIVNLLILGDFYDIALRDFGLMLGALALGRMSSQRANV